jgi:hypothetical protein
MHVARMILVKAETLNAKAVVLAGKREKRRK